MRFGVSLPCKSHHCAAYAASHIRIHPPSSLAAVCRNRFSSYDGEHVAIGRDDVCDELTDGRMEKGYVDGVSSVSAPADERVILSRVGAREGTRFPGRWRWRSANGGRTDQARKTRVLQRRAAWLENVRLRKRCKTVPKETDPPHAELTQPVEVFRWEPGGGLWMWGA